MWSRLVCQSLGIESFSADTSPRCSNHYAVNRSRCVRTTLDDRLSYSGTIDKNRRTIDHATVRNELEKLGWRVSNVVVSTRGTNYFPTLRLHPRFFLLVTSSGRKCRGSSSWNKSFKRFKSLAGIGLNNSGKPWNFSGPIDDAIVVSTDQPRRNNKTERNNKAINYSLLPPSEISLLLTLFRGQKPSIILRFAQSFLIFFWKVLFLFLLDCQD